MAFQSLPFENFEMASPNGVRSLAAYPPYGVCTRTIIVGLAAVSLSCVVLGLPADWLQPSVVGLLWGSLFLLGIGAGGVRRGNATYAGFAAAYLWLSQIALQNLTSLVTSECGLIVASIFAAGWVVAQLDLSAAPPRIAFSQVRPRRQWTMWDIAILTTLVAVICYAGPRLESPLSLLSQVGFVLCGGCGASWLAYRWVFDDHWNARKLLAVLVSSGVGFWYLARQTPAEFSLWHNVVWMLTGPVAVIAAQGLSVLAVLTAVRIDSRLMKTGRETIVDAEVFTLRIAR